MSMQPVKMCPIDIVNDTTEVMLENKANKDEQTKKAMAYTRVSTGRQVDEGVSLDAQKQRIIDYAKFKGFDLDEDDIFVERGVSASINLWDRPKGREMGERLRDGGPKHIIILKLDRMFRNVLDTLNTIDEFNRRGITLHVIEYLGQTLDTDTAFGKMILNFSSLLAQLERDQASERTKFAMNRLKETNRRFTNSIYGWDLVE